MSPAAFLLCSLVSARPAFAVEPPPTTILTLIDSARARGAGGAGAAFTDDPALLWISPVAARAGAVTATLGGQRGYIGDTAWQVLGSVPVPAGLSAFGAFAFYDAGATTDGRGRAVSAQQDVLGLAGLAGAVAPWLDAGADLKVMRSELAGTFVAKVVGADAGARAVVGPVAWSAGLQDAGARARYRGTAAPATAAIRTGVAAELPWDEEGALPRLVRLAADAVSPLDRAPVEVHAGAEAEWPGAATLRAGVMRAGLPQRWAATLGFGVGSRWYRLDYATVLGSAAGAPQVVSLTFRRAPRPVPGPEPAPVPECVPVPPDPPSGGEVAPAGAAPVQ